MRSPKAPTLVLLAFSVLFSYPLFGSSAARVTTETPEPQRRVARGRARQPSKGPRADYSKFSHATGAHRLACDSCHRSPTPNWTRARAPEPFPDVTDYPDHPSCVRCHRPQFFTGARPVICSVCHTKVSPREGARFAFRNPGERGARGVAKRPTDSQFATVFPHDKHQDVMAHDRRRRGPAADADADADVHTVRASFQQGDASQVRIDSCSACHQTYEPQGASDEEEMSGRPSDVDAKLWPKKGTFKTTPTDHASCFNCHWQDGGVAPLSSDCAGCHGLRLRKNPSAERRASADAESAAAARIADTEIGAKWLRRESARFRHEVEKHEGIGCTGCHLDITSISTLDVNTLDVPVLSCGGAGSGCHIKAKPKAILNVEVDKRRADSTFQCAKCHINYGREPTPKSHADSVPVPKS